MTWIGAEKRIRILRLVMIIISFSLLIKPAPKLLKTSTEHLTRLYNKLCAIEMALKNYTFLFSLCKKLPPCH